MGRMRVEPEDKKKTVAVQLKTKDIKRLDEFVEDEKGANPFAGVSRKSVMEALMLRFLDEEGY